jgi:hypothetical protein
LSRDAIAEREAALRYRVAAQRIGCAYGNPMSHFSGWRENAIWQRLQIAAELLK